MNNNIKNWITAFRLRTLPLSLASVGMGNILAYFFNSFEWNIFWFSFITTICLQVLSNLANDFGDAKYGADNDARIGPKRMVQDGLIGAKEMKNMIYFFALLSFIFGVILIYVSNLSLLVSGIFLIIGIISIIAAINYTIGMKKPYGYKGFGDISVFIFFGLVAVLGAFYLQAKYIDLDIFIPATSVGMFATGVLNINNIRDVESDSLAGKKSIPVKIGLDNAIIYHALLLFGGFGLSIIFVLLNFESIFQFIFVFSLPLFIKNFLAIKNVKKNKFIDPYLKQLSISTMIFVILFGVGVVLSGWY
ncbi:MAG: 1,4-dihydroxy-2-naphthoate octaprenyltransferase [Saprospiraceae bacterium]